MLMTKDTEKKYSIINHIVVDKDRSGISMYCFIVTIIIMLTSGFIGILFNLHANYIILFYISILSLIEGIHIGLGLNYNYYNNTVITE